MGTTYHSLGRKLKLHQRAPSTAKIVISASGKEVIVSLIQDQQNGGYLEDDAISPLSQGVRIPVSEGRMSPRAECPPGHLALGHNVPPDIPP